MSDGNLLRIGSCSWNYDSWKGLVYSSKQSRAVDYLPEYASRFRTAEIDSWFYKIPTVDEAASYREAVDGDFRFTAKLTSRITRPLLNGPRGQKAADNPEFLSPVLFHQYIDGCSPLLPQMDMIILEFEYLNRQKMASQGQFLEKMDAFLTALGNPPVPLGVEIRNSNYLNREYFSFLMEKGVAHVFSEKIYMPPVYEVYKRFANLIAQQSCLRLLGGDRKEIEAAAGNRWDRVVEPKAGLEDIALMVGDLIRRDIKVTVNINNHYEGSAPKTIERFVSLL